MAVTAEVDLKGPLFDGVLGRRIARGIEHARHDIGGEAADSVRRRFDVVLRHDSSAYRSGHRTPGTLRGAVQVHYDGDTVKVNNGDVIYRFWIEGTGSRNRSTRFKGYRTFRLVMQRVRVDAPRMVRRALTAAGVG